MAFSGPKESTANRRVLDTMHGYMTEIGLTPAARSRVATSDSRMRANSFGSKFAGLVERRAVEECRRN